MQHLVIEDFYLNDEAYTLLPLRYCPRITLICRFGPYYRASKGFKVFTDGHLPQVQTPSKLELQIGWEDGFHRGHISSSDNGHLAVDTVSDLVSAFCDCSLSPPELIVRPYMGKDGGCHKWCFGKKVPRDIESPPGCPKIRFTSSCLCGNGDQTGCKSMDSFRGHITC